MDNVQNCDSYINIPSLQTYGSYVADFSCLLYTSRNYIVSVASVVTSDLWSGQERV
jgi:hypothetical protein